jgi:hypothetical protein
MLINHLQPIVLLILLKIYSREKFEKNKTVLFLLITTYLLFIIPYSYKFKTTCTLKNEHNHLYWKWNDLENNELIYFIFLLCILSFGFIFPNKKIGIAFSIFSLLSYLISHVIYANQAIVGSMWCFFAAFGPIIFYIFKNFFK